MVSLQTFTASASGGSGTYSFYQWYVNGVPQFGQTASMYSYFPGSQGSYFITVTVTDSLGAISAQSSATTVTVDSALIAPTVTATSTTLDQTQNSALTSTDVSTGSGDYAYQWMEMAPSGSYVDVGTNSASFSFFTTGFTATGVWSFGLQVTDSTGAVVTSSPATVTVAVSPTVIITPVGPLIMDAGQVQTFTATASSGSGTINYQWYLDSSAVGSNSTSYSYTASAGSHSVTCKVTDSASTPVTSSASITAVTVTVSASPTVSIAPVGPLTMDVGQVQVFTATASGGTGTLSYQWYLDGSAVGTNSASLFLYCFGDFAFGYLQGD